MIRLGQFGRFPSTGFLPAVLPRVLTAGFFVAATGVCPAASRKGRFDTNAVFRPPGTVGANTAPSRHPVGRQPRKKSGRMSKELPYKKGDHVVYPTHGVGQVLDIETQTIGGMDLELIVIRFERDRMTLRVPTAKAKNSGLRKLSTKKVMDTALQTLKGRARVKRTMWSRRAQEYEAKINSGDPVAIAEVVRDLYRSAAQPEQSYSERQIYEQAFERLASEFGAVERIGVEEAEMKLEKMLQAA